MYRRIVDLDEFKNGKSDLIDPDNQEDGEDIHIQFLLKDHSRRREDRDENDLHEIDEHPLTSSQVEMMKNTIDEEIFPETPPEEDDDEDPWNNIEEEINERHLMRYDVNKKAQTWDEW